MNKESPLVSFIVAVYNEQDHILKSINSIIDQTYNHLEIIVVDDCSNDQTKNILASIKDERLKVIRNDENLGLTKSLNIAIQHTNGQYLARQDSDDYSAAHRIETQLSFIKDNPNVKLVGSNYFVVDYIGKNIKTSNNLPVTDREIRFYSIFDNPFVHSTVLIDSSIVDKSRPFYNEDYKTSQDYELWLRIIEEHSTFNINEKLVYFRFHNRSLSSSYNQQSFSLIRKLLLGNFEKYLGEKSLNKFVEVWINLNFESKKISINSLGLIFKTIDKVYEKQDFEKFPNDKLKRIKRKLKMRTFKNYFKNLIRSLN